jgi:hypothetical protein
MHSDLKIIPKLIRKAVTGKINESECDLLVRVTHRLAVIRLFDLKDAGKLYVDALPFTFKTAAFDCIADLFERDSDGVFIKLAEYFTGIEYLNSISEELLVQKYSILVVNKLNDGIFRLYHENDPFLSNLIRAIKRCAAIDKRFKKLKRFGKICLYTCEDNERLDLLPEIPMEEFESIICSLEHKEKRMRNFLIKIFDALNQQNIYHRYYGLIDLALVIKKYISQRSPVNIVSYTPEDITQEELSTVIEESLKEAETLLNRRYVQKEKISIDDFDKYFQAIKNIILDSLYYADGEERGYFEYLQEQLHELDHADYRNNHRQQFEYMVRVAKNHIREKLKELFL